VLRPFASPAFLGRIATRFRAKSTLERRAVLLTMMAAALGILFAILAPHLSIERRTGRLAADIMIIFGVIAYLGDQLVVPKKKPSFIDNVGRIVFGALTVCAIAFIASTPDIDPWLRAYRLTLSVIVLAALVSDMPRALPKRLFKRFAFAQFVLIVIQTAIFFFVTWSVDGPIAYAGAENFTKQLSQGLLSTGYPVPPFIGNYFNSAPEPKLITYSSGVIRGTPGLYDIVYWSRGDIAGTFKAYFDASDQAGNLHLIESLPHTSSIDACRAIQIIHPPVDGYKEFGNMAIADQNAMRCAVILHDTAWQHQIYGAISSWVGSRSMLIDIAESKNDCRVAYTTASEIREMYFVLEANSANHPLEMNYWKNIRAQIVRNDRNNIVLPDPDKHMRLFCRHHPQHIGLHV
jgi:hypothetical protein